MRAAATIWRWCSPGGASSADGLAGKRSRQAPTKNHAGTSTSSRAKRPAATGRPGGSSSARRLRADRLRRAAPGARRRRFPRARQGVPVLGAPCRCPVGRGRFRHRAGLLPLSRAVQVRGHRRPSRHAVDPAGQGQVRRDLPEERRDLSRSRQDHRSGRGGGRRIPPRRHQPGLRRRGPVLSAAAGRGSRGAHRLRRCRNGSGGAAGQRQGRRLVDVDRHVDLDTAGVGPLDRTRGRRRRGVRGRRSG